MTSVWILGDQLTPTGSALEGLRPDQCVLVMVESLARGRQLAYHKHKLILLWAAMRHFRDEMRGLGYTVDYYEAQPDFGTALKDHVQTHRPTQMRLMEASEYGVTERLTAAVEELGVPIEITPNTQFVCRRDEVNRRDFPIMEDFYRHVRRKTGLLMEGNKPAGGQFNYDALNREKPPKGHVFPHTPAIPPDAITREVMEFVAREFPDNFGRADTFWWPTTRAEAESLRDHFLDDRLDMFGPYEDASVRGERSLYHSLLSALMNLGLLDPLETCRAAEARWRNGTARLPSVEGYVRQIIGWREYVRLYYWEAMPDLDAVNYFEAEEPLPAFYTSGETDMACLRESVLTLRDYGTTHHIQRLMILGNFALILGVRPQAIRDWFWLAYADAYDWVVTPNVLALSQYADGGTAHGGLATKPYASAAAYVNRMSDYCGKCRYDPKKSVGEDACPYNALFWDFHQRHEAKFRPNPRLRNLLLGLDRRTSEQRQASEARADDLRARLRAGERV